MHPNLRYQVRLGHGNIELWIKQLGDREYIKVNPNVFRPYTMPKIDNITTLPNLGVSPPKAKPLNTPGIALNHQKSPLNTKP